MEYRYKEDFIKCAVAALPANKALHNALQTNDVGDAGRGVIDSAITSIQAAAITPADIKQLIHAGQVTHLLERAEQQDHGQKFIDMWRNHRAIDIVQSGENAAKYVA